MAKLKERPEDFFVREIKNLNLKEKGRYAYFLLRKRNMTTLDAVRRVAKELGVSAETVGTAGLKDKEAITEQFISVENPRAIKNLREENLTLTFLGYGDEPVRMGEIEGNYFEITVRSIGKKKREYLRRSIDFVREFGFENYFGEQRFGSVKFAREFVAKLLLKGDYEGALKEYLTSMKDRRRRRELLKRWGRWKEFIKFMPQTSELELSIVRELIKGKTFEEALSRLPKRIKLLFSFAYQSYLWNRYLNTFVVRYFKHCSVPFLQWRLSFIREITPEVFEEIKDLEIPFLGTQYKPSNKKIELIIREVLEEERLTPQDLEACRIGIKLLSDGVRKAFVFPKDLKVLEEGGDFVKLSFVLPPGSYATVLLRKLLCSPL